MTKSKQLNNGNSAETLVANFFAERGYWASVFQKRKDGSQPVDIVAMKENYNWLIDAKYVENDISFPFSRIEPNQITSLDYALNYSHIQNVGFVIYFERFNKLYFLKFQDFLKLKEKGAKSVRYDELYEMDVYLK